MAKKEGAKAPELKMRYWKSTKNLHLNGRGDVLKGEKIWSRADLSVYGFKEVSPPNEDSKKEGAS